MLFTHRNNKSSNSKNRVLPNILFRKLSARGNGFIGERLVLREGGKDVIHGKVIDVWHAASIQHSKVGELAVRKGEKHNDTVCDSHYPKTDLQIGQRLEQGTQAPSSWYRYLTHYP